MKIFSHRIFLWDASIDFAYACKTLLINLTTMKSALTNSIRFVLFISIAALISSCSSSSNVADGGILQKRKYRKGVHLNILKKHKVQEQSIPDEVILKILKMNQIGKQLTMLKWTNLHIQLVPSMHR